VLLVERLDLEVPHQPRFALPDRQQHQAAVDRRERQAFVRPRVACSTPPAVCSAFGEIAANPANCAAEPTPFVL
jgi:hypothetical protein